MFEWLAILKTLLSLANNLTQYLNDKQLLKAGEAQAIKQGLESGIVIIEKATKARRDALRDFDKRDGLPDETDPNLRD